RGSASSGRSFTLLPGRIDAERIVAMHRSLLEVHAADVCGRWSLPQPALQLGQLRLRAGRVDFHPAVLQIFHIAGQAQVGRNPLDKIPESDTLHPTPDLVEPGP